MSASPRRDSAGHRRCRPSADRPSTSSSDGARRARRRRGAPRSRGWRDATTVAPDRSIGRDLAGADLSCESGCSAAYAPPAPQHRPSSSSSTSCATYGASTVRTPRARAARDASGTGPAPRPRDRRRGAAPAGGDRARAASHSCTSCTRAAERDRLGGAEQMPVVLHRRAASGGVDEDRCVARHRPHDSPTPVAAASSDKPGVDVRAHRSNPPPAADGSATPRRSPRSRASPRRARPLPRVHDAAREQPHVACRWARGGSALRRQRRAGRAARQRASTRSSSALRPRRALEPAVRAAGGGRAAHPARRHHGGTSCRSRGEHITRAFHEPAERHADGHAVSQPRHCTHASM